MRRFVFLAITTTWLVNLPFSATAANPQVGHTEKSAAEVASELDSILVSENLIAPDAPRADDETLFRRLALNLVGELPRPAEITAFALDPTKEGKVARTVERYLADSRFGENWARYWRDVILYRRTDDRALITHQPAVEYLREQFNGDASWKQIATDFITASGRLSENGQTAIIAAQWGEGVDIAAEVSRIFLGVQIQCAQCHDHPTDRWKRRQFHELAAFFPRVAVRPENVMEKKPRPEFVVASVEREPRRKKEGKPIRTIEHYMPDLENPAAQGELIQPAFFVGGQTLPTGKSDVERRSALAEWLTAPSSPWFAKAYVNRVWAELTGRGFYEPIDDLGADRECASPAALDLLAGQFVQHGYRVKWLTETICLTRYYSRAPGEKAPPESADSAVPACPQRLQSDQLFNSLLTALGIDETTLAGRVKPPGGAGPRGKLATPRMAFATIFGFDPSTPRDELGGSIAQALAMMNQPGLNLAVVARPAAGLGKLLNETRGDDEVVTELYLRCLAREPREDERRICLDYVKQVGDRREAFEDLLWSLVNSAEFLYRD